MLAALELDFSFTVYRNQYSIILEKIGTYVVFTFVIVWKVKSIDFKFELPVMVFELVFFRIWFQWLYHIVFIGFNSCETSFSQESKLKIVKLYIFILSCEVKIKIRVTNTCPKGKKMQNIIRLRTILQHFNHFGFFPPEQWIEIEQFTLSP